MTTVIERAKAEAERRWPSMANIAHSSAAIGFVEGATFATTLTPEQVETGARADFEYHMKRNPDEAVPPRWEALDVDQRDHWINGHIAAARAMGFEVPS